MCSPSLVSVHIEIALLHTRKIVVDDIVMLAVWMLYLAVCVCFPLPSMGAELLFRSGTDVIYFHLREKPLSFRFFSLLK